jgi:DNA-binding NarL/FixJ family response regulator
VVIQHGAPVPAGSSRPIRPIRLLLADDQHLLRSGFRAVLAEESDLDVVGEAADGADAVQLARRLLPDVVLMDIRMPRLDGIAATRAIVAAQLPIRVLILTMVDPTTTSSPRCAPAPAATWPRTCRRRI